MWHGGGPLTQIRRSLSDLYCTVLYSVGPLMKTAAPAIAGPTTLHPHVLYHLYLYTVSIVLYG